MSQGWCAAAAGKWVSLWPRLGKGLRSRMCAAGATGVLAWAMALATAAGTPQALAFSPAPMGMPTVARTELPPQGRTVLRKIENGESFRHDKDGSVFGNRERLLPRQTRGYYREYTVPTPGLKHRGARRIVCGGEAIQRPEACYYTEDHYASFKLIVQ